MRIRTCLGAALALTLAAGASAQVFVGTGTPAPINDTTLTVVSIPVASGPASITDVNVVFNATHTWDSDCDILVVAPDGSFCVLSTDNGGTGDNYNVRYDQCAATPATAMVAPGNSNLRPEGTAGNAGWSGTGANALPVGTDRATLDGFNGLSANGTWQLWVYDDAGGDTGSIARVSLEFNGAADSFLSFAPASGASSPTGTGLAANAAAGGTTVLQLTVSPGQCPVSTGVGVTVNAAAIGAGTVTLLDNGIAPDVTAGDNIFRGNVTVGGAAIPGPYTLNASITDGQSRTGSGTIAFTVNPPPPTNDNCANAIAVVAGTTSWNNVSATSSGVVASCQTLSGKDIWYSYTTGAGANAVSIFTCDQTTNDTVITVYDACGGTEIACDDDTCAGTNGLASTLTFCGTPSTTYLIRLASFGSAPAGGSGTFTITEGASVPSGVMSFVPSCINPGNSVNIEIDVTGASCPDSVSYTVTANGASIGAGTITLLDDGVAPDAVAGDNTFTASVTAPGSGGSYSLPFTVTDNQSRVGNGSGTMLVQGADEAGDLPGTAATISNAASVSGVIDCGGTDADMWMIEICDPANFSATTIGGATWDTQLFLFNMDGTGIAANDDHVTPTTGLQSTITNTFTGSLTAGNYLIAISGFNRDPQDGSAANIFGTPIARSEVGPAIATPIAGWATAATFNTGAYTIFFTGVCVPSAGCYGACVADFDDGSGTGTPDGGVTIDDLLYYLSLFDSGNVCADVDDGSGTNTLDGGVTIDDLIYYLARFDAGC